jgi:hypothetical protein
MMSLPIEQILYFASTVLTTLPSLIAAGAQVGGLIQTTNDSIARMQAENRGPTPQEWDAINGMISELRASLHGG